MNKKHIIIAIVLILILTIAGYLWYKKVQEDRMGPVSFDSFKRIETDGKVFLENKDIGLKFMVPQGWEVQDLPWSSISVASQDFEPFNGKSPVPQRGCLININPKIQIEGSEYDLDYTDLRQRIDSDDCMFFKNYEKENCKIVDILGLKGIRDNYSENGGIITNLSIPYNNVIYHFEAYIFGENKDKCLQEFDNLLSTISIKKK